MALNRRLCFTAQEPWVMVAYEMIFLIFILLSREIWRHSLSLQVFCQIESALKERRTESLGFQRNGGYGRQMTAAPMRPSIRISRGFAQRSSFRWGVSRTGAMRSSFPHSRNDFDW